MDLVSVAVTLALLLGPAADRVPAAGQRPGGSIVTRSDSAAAPSRPVPPGAGAAEAAVPDAWLGEDKLRHFLMSFAVTTYAYAGTRTFAGHDAAAAVAVGAGVAAGVGKELYDRAAGRPFSLRDLAADGLGMLAAWALLRNTR